MPNAIITGGSSGLGEATARELARRGYAVGLIARRADLLDRIAEEIRGGGGRATAAAADVTDRQALFAAVRAIESVHGPTDLMLANAGTSQASASTRARSEVFTRIMRINYDGVVHAIDAVLPAMLERGEGQLAAVSSLASFIPVPNQGAYTASKAAVSRLMETLSAELRPRGIQVTCIHPGFVKTPLGDLDKSPRPGEISAEDAARRVVDGLEGGRRTVNFPFLLSALVKLATTLPAPLFEALMARVSPVPDPKRRE